MYIYSYIYVYIYEYCIHAESRKVCKKEVAQKNKIT